LNDVFRSSHPQHQLLKIKTQWEARRWTQTRTIITIKPLSPKPLVDLTSLHLQRVCTGWIYTVVGSHVILAFPKALGKLGNIVVETFVILDVSSNVSMFAHPWKHCCGNKICFPRSKNVSYQIQNHLMFPYISH
jgi:hypothetical protein